MDIEEILEKTLEEILIKMGVEYNKIEVSEEEKGLFAVNIKTDNPSHLIGYHGETMQSLQHLLKVLSWKQTGSDENYHITLDVDDYRKRQEENVITLTDRKVDQIRKSGRPQKLPPMSPYFRRKVHLHCMGAGFDDIETFSEGDADLRHVVIKSK